jgi:hypothetical protein
MITNVDVWGNAAMDRRESKRHALAMGVFVLSGLLGLESCHRNGVEYRAGRVVSRLPGASVVASSDASYRLIIGPSLRDAPSRLWVVHARIETFDDVPLRIDGDGAQLVLADGTHAHPLDEPRVAALLERTEIGAANPNYAPYGLSQSATGLAYEEKKQVRDKILASPFVGGEVTRSHPIEGYMVVDARRELASLEGAMLEVVATRLIDGAFIRRTYRFPARSEGARADATTSGP